LVADESTLVAHESRTTAHLLDAWRRDHHAIEMPGEAVIEGGWRRPGIHQWSEVPSGSRRAP